MSFERIDKLRAMLFTKQLTKQIDALLSKKVDNWDKFGNIKDINLDKQIEESLSIKRKRRAEYRAYSG